MISTAVLASDQEAEEAHKRETVVMAGHPSAHPDHPATVQRIPSQTDKLLCSDGPVRPSQAVSMAYVCAGQVVAAGGSIQHPQYASHAQSSSEASGNSVVSQVAIPQHMQAQRVSVNTNSPLLVNLLSNSQHVPVSRSFSPMTGGPSMAVHPTSVPSCTPIQNAPTDSQIVGYHQVERQVMYSGQEEEGGMCVGSHRQQTTPTATNPYYAPPQRSVYAGGQQQMFPAQVPHQRIGYVGPPIPNYVRTVEEQTAPPPKKRKKPTKKQLKDEISAAQQSQPTAFYTDARLVHPQQGIQTQAVGAAYAGNAGYGSIGGQGQSQHPMFYQQQQMAWQQRMMQSRQYHPQGTPNWPARAPPVPYPPSQHGGNPETGGVSRGPSSDLQSDSNSPVTPFAQPQPMAPDCVRRDSGDNLFSYPSTSNASSMISQSTPGRVMINPSSHCASQTTLGTKTESPGRDEHDIGKLFSDEGCGDLGDLDDIEPMAQLAETMTTEENERLMQTSRSNGKNGETFLETSINSVVDMVAKGGGALSAPTPPVPSSNSASNTAPSTPTSQNSLAPIVRRKNTPSGVTVSHQTIQHIRPPSNTNSMQCNYPPSSPSTSISYEHNVRAHHFHAARHAPNGRPLTNGHELPNGSRRLTTGEESNPEEAHIAAILEKVKAVGDQEKRAKEQKAAAAAGRISTGTKGRGGSTGTGRKKKRKNELIQGSPRTDDYLIGMSASPMGAPMVAPRPSSSSPMGAPIIAPRPSSSSPMGAPMGAPRPSSSSPMGAPMGAPRPSSSSPMGAPMGAPRPSSSSPMGAPMGAPRPSSSSPMGAPMGAPRPSSSSPMGAPMVPPRPSSSSPMGAPMSAPRPSTSAAPNSSFFHQITQQPMHIRPQQPQHVQKRT